MRLRLAVAALAALVLAGCGGSSAPKGLPALIFVSTKDTDYAIFRADADGKHVRRVTTEKGDPSSPAGLFFQIEPAWSPDGRQIAFVSGRDGVGHIFVMRADGTGTRRLTNTKQDDGRPSWSPDGRLIVFSREGALFRAPVAGGPARRVGRGLGSAADPVYSPDGKLIAYDYRRPGYSIREVYVMKFDGTGVRQVTRLGQVSGLPAWAPDGKRIAFQSNARLGHYEIYTIGVDGSRLEQVTASTTTDTIQPAYAPDGSLAFTRDGAIWVDRTGTETQITSGENNDSAPAWRPIPPK